MFTSPARSKKNKILILDSGGGATPLRIPSTRPGARGPTAYVSHYKPTTTTVGGLPCIYEVDGDGGGAAAVALILREGVCQMGASKHAVAMICDFFFLRLGALRTMSTSSRSACCTAIRSS